MSLEFRLLTYWSFRPNFGLLWLRSAYRGDFAVPHARTAIKHHRAFSIVGTSACNSLPSEVRRLPRDLSSFFYKLLNTFIFALAWAESSYLEVALCKFHRQIWRGQKYMHAIQTLHANITCK